MLRRRGAVSISSRLTRPAETLLGSDPGHVEPGHVEPGHVDPGHVDRHVPAGFRARAIPVLDCARELRRPVRSRLRGAGAEPPVEHEQPEWLGPPSSELGVAVPLGRRARLVRSAASSRCRTRSCTRTASSFSSSAHVDRPPRGRVEPDLPRAARRPDGATASRRNGLSALRPRAAGWRVAFRTSTKEEPAYSGAVDSERPGAPASRAARVALAARAVRASTRASATGSGRSPAEGIVRLYCEWPVAGIELASVEVDAAPLREAAGAATRLWSTEREARRTWTRDDRQLRRPSRMTMLRARAPVADALTAAASGTPSGVDQLAAPPPARSSRRSTGRPARRAGPAGGGQSRFNSSRNCLRRAHDQVGPLAERRRALGRDDRDADRRLQPVERREAVEVGRVVAGVERACRPLSSSRCRTAVPFVASTGGSTSSTIRPQRGRSPAAAAAAATARARPAPRPRPVRSPVVEGDRQRLPSLPGPGHAARERMHAIGPRRGGRLELQAVLAHVAQAVDTDDLRARRSPVRPVMHATRRVAAGQPLELARGSRAVRDESSGRGTIGASTPSTSSKSAARRGSERSGPSGSTCVEYERVLKLLRDRAGRQASSARSSASAAGS